MEYVSLGRTGVKISRICLGCYSFGNDEAWKIELDEARRLVKNAIDLGVTFFDTANSYSLGRSEEILGECLEGYRDDVVIATKVYFPMGEGPNDSGLSRRHIMQQIRASLKRLQMDYVDLYQIHRWDYGTPIEETMRALHDIVSAGLTHYVGASSMFAWQFQKALYTSDRLGLVRFVSMQNHYNLVYREEEREMIPLCKAEGIALLPWSPLARGFLTGKYKQGITPKSPRYETDKFLGERYFRPEDYAVLDALLKVADAKQVTPTQIAISWLLHKQVAAPVVGAKSLGQMEEAIEALDVKLDSDEIRRLEAPYKCHQVMGYR